MPWLKVHTLWDCVPATVPLYFWYLVFHHQSRTKPNASATLHRFALLFSMCVRLRVPTCLNKDLVSMFCHITAYAVSAG